MLPNKTGLAASAFNPIVLFSIPPKVGQASCKAGTQQARTCRAGRALRVLNIRGYFVRVAAENAMNTNTRKKSRTASRVCDHGRIGLIRGGREGVIEPGRVGLSAVVEPGDIDSSLICATAAPARTATATILTSHNIQRLRASTTICRSSYFRAAFLAQGSCVSILHPASPSQKSHSTQGEETHGRRLRYRRSNKCLQRHTGIFAASGLRGAGNGVVGCEARIEIHSAAQRQPCRSNIGSVR
jgi:hypothetical protein